MTGWEKIKFALQLTQRTEILRNAIEQLRDLVNDVHDNKIIAEEADKRFNCINETTEPKLKLSRHGSL